MGFLNFLMILDSLLEFPCLEGNARRTKEQHALKPKLRISKPTSLETLLLCTVNSENTELSQYQGCSRPTPRRLLSPSPPLSEEGTHLSKDRSRHLGNR